MSGKKLFSQIEEKPKLLNDSDNNGKENNNISPDCSPLPKKGKKIKIEKFDGLEETIKSLSKSLEEKIVNSNKVNQPNVADKDAAFVTFLMTQMNNLPENIKLRLQAEISKLACQAMIDAMNVLK